MNSIKGKLTPMSSTLVSFDEMIGQRKFDISSCYKIKDMVCENGYFSAKNKLNFFMHKYQSKDCVFVFYKFIKIKNKAMLNRYKTKYLEAMVMYKNNDN